MPSRPSRQIVTFANPEPRREYVIRHECPEYTALCPVTGQPDFGTIVVVYAPDKKCIELKSLKLYLWSFRDRKVFCEALAAEIAGEVVRAADPHEVTVTLTQQPRGGIVIEAVASRTKGA